MSNDTPYPIGAPNKKWGKTERKAWLELQTVKRSYPAEVLDKLAFLRDAFTFEQYSALSHNPKRYPILTVKSKNWQMGKPTALITGAIQVELTEMMIHNKVNK